MVDFNILSLFMRLTLAHSLTHSTLNMHHTPFQYFISIEFLINFLVYEMKYVNIATCNASLTLYFLLVFVSLICLLLLRINRKVRCVFDEIYIPLNASLLLLLLLLMYSVVIWRNYLHFPWWTRRTGESSIKNDINFTTNAGTQYCWPTVPIDGLS